MGGKASGAAAFGRLCVETTAVEVEYADERKQPPSGGCVLKPIHPHIHLNFSQGSRLRAAVC